MSLFDELRCECPLPDGWNPEGRLFQTKDTPEQRMALYVLRADGTLVHEATHDVIALHGLLTFYTGNIRGSGPDGYYTDDEEDAWWAEYVALYDHGTLLKLEGDKAPQPMMQPRLTREAWQARSVQRRTA